MARITLNISDKLNKEMRDYISKNDLTITTFIHLALTNYLDDLKREEQEMFKLIDELMKGDWLIIENIKGEIRRRAGPATSN